MIISKTPFRISFFGGGTDYPAWFKENGGMVLVTTVNKYCYISCRYLPPFFEHKSRIIWSKMENVKDIDEIQHPSARETLKFMDIKEGVEIHHDADLPARSGIGSSSSFTVGLLHSLYALKGIMPTKMRLAKEAIYIEQDILKENVGLQDQISTAVGGFNKIEFKPSGEFNVVPIVMSNERLEELQNSLMLVFTGFSRTASEIAAEQIKKTNERKKELTEMYKMVDEAVDILNSGRQLVEFGKLIHESWQLKRSLTNKISNPEIDEIYEIARKFGVIGGKLCGAGGGGFFLFFVKPENQSKVKEGLKHLLHIPFKLEDLGSQIIFYESDLQREK